MAVPISPARFLHILDSKFCSQLFLLNQPMEKAIFFVSLLVVISFALKILLHGKPRELTSGRRFVRGWWKRYWWFEVEKGCWCSYPDLFMSPQFFSARTIKHTSICISSFLSDNLQRGEYEANAAPIVLCSYNIWTVTLGKNNVPALCLLASIFLHHISTRFSFTSSLPFLWGISRLIKPNLEEPAYYLSLRTVYDLTIDWKLVWSSFPRSCLMYSIRFSSIWETKGALR